MSINTAANYRAPPKPYAEQLRESAFARTIDVSQAEREDILADIQTIEEFLKKNPSNDAMTQEIHDWHDMFKMALRSPIDHRYILKTFISNLQDILVDPNGVPLDEDSYLGSDGEAYGHKTYFIFIHSVSEPYNSRSPSDLDNPAPFTVEPHPVVRRMVDWLKKYNALVHSEEDELLYQQLMEEPGQAESPLPPEPVEMTFEEKKRLLKERLAEREAIIEEEPLPPPPQMTLEEKRRLVKERLAQMEPIAEEERKRELEIHDKKVREDLDLKAEQNKKDLAQLQQELKKKIAEHEELVEKLKRKDLEKFDRLSRLLDHNNIDPEEFQKGLGELAELMESSSLESRLTDLEERIPELEKADADLKKKTKDLSKEIAEVGAQIQETRKAIKKVKKEKQKKLITTLVIIGASAFATWALKWAIQELAVSLGKTLEVSAYIKPAPGGNGAMINLGGKI